MNNALARSLYRKLSRAAKNCEVLPAVSEVIDFKLSELDEFPKSTSDVKRILRNEFQKPATDQTLQVFSLIRDVSDRCTALNLYNDIDYSLEYPVFMYNPPYYPNARQSFHFFEPRYRKLIKHAQDSNKRWVYLKSGANKNLNGTSGVIVWSWDCDVGPDGKANTTVIAGPRVRVIENRMETFKSSESLRWVKVEPFSDEIVETELEEVEQVRLEVLELLKLVWDKLDEGNDKSFVRDLVKHYGSMPLHPEKLGLWICSWSLSDIEKRQYFLNSTSTLERLEFCRDLLLNLVDQPNKF